MTSNSKDFLAAHVSSLRATMLAIHTSNVALSYTWRIEQLERLERLLSDSQDAIRAALFADLGKEYTEATVTEICTIQDEVEYTMAHLKQWMKPEQVASPGICWPSRCRIEKRPLAPPGVLVLGPSNYPFSFCLHPAIGSLAAGNPTLVKPSELCPHVGDLLTKLVAQYFPDKALQVITGGIPETTELLKHRWGVVFFTGSERVGKIVATAAAQTLTPIVLELGGKAPCIVDESCPSDLAQVANRILWAKLLNSGQSCAAPDYILVHKSIATQLMRELPKSLSRQFPDATQQEMGRIVHRSHAERLLSLIQEVEQLALKSSDTKIVCGGSKACDVGSLYIAPTIIWNPPPESRLFQQEIFGPILPVVVYETRDQAVQFARKASGDAPLCLYVFTKSESVFSSFCNQIPAGSAVRNDCLVHLASSQIPFGGLGSSGYGNYHGKFGFETFSHKLPVMYRPCAPGMDLAMARYHPISKTKSWIIINILMKIPYIPVVRTTTGLLLGSLLVASVALRTIPSLQAWWKDLVLPLAASSLEHMALFLRKG